MGWTVTHKPKDMTIKKFFENEFNAQDGSAKVLDCAVVNMREAYIAYKHRDGKISGIVCLLEYYPHDPEYNFGYKEMGEECGPHYYNCPKRILDMLSDPPPNDWAKTWREKCRENLEKKKNNDRRARAGDIIRFEKPLRFTDGSTYDTFKVIKSGKKTLFRTAKIDNGEWYIDNIFLYDIRGWTKRNYQVIA